MTDTALLLWGKTDDRTGLLHPLLFHMLDAGHVAAALWSHALPMGLKSELAAALGLDVEGAGRLMAYWTALHDMGKAGPAFQRRYAPALEFLSAGGLPFPPETTYTPQPHGLVTGWILCSGEARLDLDPDAAEALARALSGHHGAWPDSASFAHVSRRANLGGPEWRQARAGLWQRLEQAFDPPAPGSFPEEGVERNLFLTLLSGLVTVADWMASMQSIFPAAGLEQDWLAYRQISQQKALEVIHKQGWTAWNDPSAGAPISFQQAFPRLAGGPRPVQSEIFAKAFDAPLPALALIEAPTGIGKTEIAFLLADRWLRRGGGRGLYVAMPTQATSNQMYDRTVEFLSARYPGEFVHVQLSHGHALLQDTFERRIIASVGEGPEAGVAAAGWFLPRKRTLLAPYGVGTVDQVFLSVLQTRHFFVRLFGLHGKVVIFDEVHAYDAYQSELFCRLLAWLRAMNVSVILLSATLPSSVREAFVRAYGAKTQPASGGGYPCLTLVHDGQAVHHRLPAPASRPVALDWLGGQPADVVAYLRDKLAGGGCAAVICNTVARAQEIYRAVVDSGLAPGASYLFHARFPFAWRSATEQKVLSLFGRDSTRPRGPAVVVATQVIEQSLDLDFDLMISELAPIDLLIQRAGRLHRHQRGARPERVSTPRLALMQPHLTAEGDPDFGPNAYVYRRYHLLRTSAVLAERSALSLPEETPTLIEAVYGDQPLPLSEREAAVIREARVEMEKAMQESVRQARHRLVLPPDHEELLYRPSEKLEEEESSGLHAAFRALTREAPPGVSLVCLHRLPDGRLSLEPDDPAEVIDIDRPPEKEEIKKLLSHVVQVQRPDVVQHFAGRPLHPAWKVMAALRYHYPIVFENGAAPLEGLPLSLRLDRTYGLSFKKEDT